MYMCITGKSCEQRNIEGLGPHVVVFGCAAHLGLFGARLPVAFVCGSGCSKSYRTERGEAPWMMLWGEAPFWFKWGEAPVASLCMTGER